MPGESRGAANSRASSRAHARAPAGSGFNTPEPPDTLDQRSAAVPPLRSAARLAERPRCSCGHRPEQHDRVATRYCLATVTSRLRRGCICATPPAEPVHQP
jgi:hypothetical protein